MHFAAHALAIYDENNGALLSCLLILSCRYFLHLTDCMTEIMLIGINAFSIFDKNRKKPCIIFFHARIASFKARLKMTIKTTNIQS